MCSVTDTCFMCSNTSNCKVIDEKIVKLVEYALPEITIIKKGIPLSICTNCSNFLQVFNKFKHESVENCQEQQTNIKATQSQSRDQTTSKNHNQQPTNKTLETEKQIIKNQEIVHEYKEIGQNCTNLEETKTTDTDESSDYQNSNNSKKRVLQCPVCFKIYKIKSNLDSHLKTHRDVKKLQCEHCYKIFALKSLLKTHLEAHNSNPNSESTEENTDDEIQEDNSGEKDKLKYCPLCNEVFTNTDNLKEHMICHAGLKRIRLTKEVIKSKQCPICDKRFSKFTSEMKKHIKSHIGDTDLSCATCDKSFSTRAALKYHMSIHMGIIKSYECPICPRTYRARSDLRRHMKGQDIEHLKAFEAGYLKRRINKEQLQTEGTTSGIQSQDNCVNVENQLYLNNESSQPNIVNQLQEQGNQLQTEGIQLQENCTKVETQLYLNESLQTNQLQTEGAILGIQSQDNCINVENQLYLNESLLPNIVNQLQTEETILGIQSQEHCINVENQLYLNNETLQTNIVNQLQTGGTMAENQLQEHGIGTQLHLNKSLSSQTHTNVNQLQKGGTMVGNRLHGHDIGTNLEAHLGDQLHTNINQLQTGGTITGNQLQEHGIGTQLQKDNSVQLQTDVINLEPDLGVQLQKNNETNPKEDNQVNQENRKSRKCPICNEIFTQIDELEKHMQKYKDMKKISFNEKIYKSKQCPICDRILKSSWYVIQHLKTFHIGVKGFQCSECKKSFTAKESLEYHMTNHTGARNYKCPVCHKTYRVNSILRKHMKQKGDDEHLLALKKMSSPNMKINEEKDLIETEQKFEEIYIKSEPQDDYFSDSETTTFNTDDTDQLQIERQEPEIENQLHTNESTVKIELHEETTSEIQLQPQNSNLETKEHENRTTLRKIIPKKVNQDKTKQEKSRKCPVCLEIFTDAADLDKHMKKYKNVRKIIFNESLYRSKQCPVCDKVFKQISCNVIRHVKITHIGIKDYQCGICNRAFTSKDSLEFHMTKHTGMKNFTCTVCQKSYQTKKVLRKHMKGKGDYVHLKALKELKTNEKIEKKSKVTYKYPNTRQNTDTGHKFEEIYIKNEPHDEYLSDSETTIDDETSQTDVCNDKPTLQTILCCPVCSKTFTTETELVSHLKKHEHNSDSDSTTENQTEMSQTETNLEAHFDFEFQREKSVATSLLKKMEEMFRNNSEDGSPKTCPICDAEFLQFSVEMREHITTHIGTGDYYCSICKKSFTNRATFKYHMSVHLGIIESYQCPLCPKSYRAKNDLRKHMRRQDAEHLKALRSGCLRIKPAKKKNKNTPIENQSDLEELGSDYETNIDYNKPRKCFICDDEFTKAHLLIKHIKTHEDPTKILYNTEIINTNQCFICDKSSNNILQHIKQHLGEMDTITQETTKKIVSIEINESIKQEQTRNCPVCTQEFENGDLLGLHIKEHAGLKNITFNKDIITSSNHCLVCNKMIKCNNNMIRHLKIHIGVKEFNCPECNKAFTAKDSVEYHMAIHTGAKDFKCSVCKRSFRTNSILRKHMRERGDKVHLKALEEMKTTKEYILKYGVNYLTGKQKSSGSVVNKF